MEIREGRNKRKEDNLLVDVDKTAFSKGNTDTQTSGKKDRRKRWHERERERERERRTTANEAKLCPQAYCSFASDRTG